MRIKDAAEETKEPDRNIIALAASSQISGEQQEFLELYYQYPMTWLTHAANLNPDDDKPNDGFDKREFRRKRRLNEKATVDKKGTCMGKLLKSIAKGFSVLKRTLLYKANAKLHPRWLLTAVAPNYSVQNENTDKVFKMCLV